jgi:hypothetical protein
MHNVTALRGIGIRETREEEGIEEGAIAGGEVVIRLEGTLKLKIIWAMEGTLKLKIICRKS